MTIAIHINGSHPNAVESFNYISFYRLAKEKPEHHFIFIFDSPMLHDLALPSNCTPVTLPPRIKNNLLAYYWYNAKIPVVLQKYNANVFVTAGVTCSLRTPIPQCMVIEISPFEKDPGLYLKKFLPLFINKVSAIVCMGATNALTVVEKYPISKDKIKLIATINNSELMPADIQTQERIKEKFTNGSDFFLYQNNIRDLIMVLKAFSVFKKWQKSSLKLVVSYNIKNDAPLQKELASYKFKNEIIFINPSDFENVLPGAYSLINTGGENICLKAFQCGVPVIHIDRAAAEILAEAPLYSQRNETDLGNKMMQLYKDEHLRNDCIGRGHVVSDSHSPAGVNEKLWQLINSIALP